MQSDPSPAGPGRARFAVRWLAAPAMAVLAIVLAVPADAVPITRTYNVTVNNVHDQTGNNVAAPANPVIGSFTVTFDPALLTIANQTTGITVNTLNVTVASPIALSYNHNNTDELQIGGLAGGTGGLTDGTADFLLDIFDAPNAAPFFGNMDYTIFATSAATGQFSDFAADIRADGILSVTATAAIPDPPMLATILAGGLLSVGIHKRRKRRRL